MTPVLKKAEPNYLYNDYSISHFDFIFGHQTFYVEEGTGPTSMLTGPLDPHLVFFCRSDLQLSRSRTSGLCYFSALVPCWQKHVRKVVGGFGKESYVRTGVRKPGNTCVTDRHDMTLAVKVALNPNTTNQQTNVVLNMYM